ncbi:hypothetical protein AKO1_010170, partial [Acrasis kona]
MTYTITDGLATVTKSIYITVVDTAPVILPNYYSIFWRTQSTGSQFNLTNLVSDAEQDPVTLTVSVPSSGVASVNGLVVTYKQNLNFLGNDSFTVTANDGWAPATSANYIVNVYDTAPVAYPLSLSMHFRETNKPVNAAPTDADPQDANNLSIVSTSGSFDGTVKIVGNTNLTYTPGSFTLGVRSIQYTVSDGLLTSSNTLTVTVVDAAPTNVDYSRDIQWAQCISQGVLINVGPTAVDTDSFDANFLSFTQVSNANYGTVSKFNSTTFLYKCNSGVGKVQDSFRYRTSDQVLSNDNQITINVVNNAPVALDDNYLLHWTLAVSNLQVTANDTDIDGDAITISSFSTTTPFGASITTDSNKKLLTYSMTSKQRISSALNQVDRFSYAVTDSVDVSNTANVGVTLYNTPPVANPLAQTIQWNQVATGTLSFSDPDSLDTATVSSLTLRVQNTGSVQLNNANTGAVTFTPSNSPGTTTTYSNNVIVDYVVTDGLSTSSNTWTVTVKNTAPVAQSVTKTVNRNYNSPTMTFTGVLPNPNDADGDPVSISSMSLVPTERTTPSYNPTSNSFSLTVPALFTGTKVVQWTTTDGQLTSSVATYTINYINAAPTCTSNSASTFKLAPYNVNVLNGCSDANNDPITAVTQYTQSPSAIGTSSLSSSGALSFTSSGKQSGLVTITYRATDTIDQSTDTTFSINVVNRAPTGKSVRYEFKQAYTNDYEHVISTFLTDSSASDPDAADTVSISDVNVGTCPGSVSLRSGVIYYKPGDATYSNTCVLNVIITDDDTNNKLTATVGVTVYISSPRTPPKANDDSYSVDQAAGQIVIPVSSMLSNDVAPPSTGITFAGLVPCTTGYCYKTPVYSASTQSVTLEVDRFNCIADKFQYAIQTTDAFQAQDIATVTVTFTNCYCRSQVDIYFVLDNSGSIGESNWKLVRNFAYNITQKLEISSDKVNVGFVDFGNNGYNILTLSSNKNTIQNMAKNMGYRGEGTATKSGLYAAIADITGVHPANRSTVGTDGKTLVAKGRYGVPKVLLLITDGMPNIPFGNSPQNGWYGNPSKQYIDCQTVYADGNSNPVNCTQGVFAQQMTQKPQDCRYASNSGLPCSDPTWYTNQINSW